MKAQTRSHGTGGVALFGALSLAMTGAGACGGASSEPKAPAASTGAAAPFAVHDGGVPMVVAAQTPPAGDELSGAAKDAYQNGWAAWAAGDLMAAKAAFQDAASKAPTAGAPQYSLGCVLERLGDNLGALDAYRAAFTANPGKYDVAMAAYSLLQANTGHGPDADSFLAGKLAQKADDLVLMTALAEVRSIDGDSPGCQKLGQDILARNPQYADAMIVIARDYYRQHKWELAQAALRAILKEDNGIPPRAKGNPEALLMRALIERDLGDREDAMKDFAQAVATRPDMFEAYINLGEMRLEAGNATEAQDPLEKAARYAPKVATAHLDLGDCYRILGRVADAKAELDKALGLDSTLAGAHYNLGLLYLFPGKSTVPGATSDDDRISKAIQEFDTYKSMRGAKAPKGEGDDVEQLLGTAKQKQKELQMAAAAAGAAPPSSGPPTAGTPDASAPSSGAAATSPAP